MNQSSVSVLNRNYKFKKKITKENNNNKKLTLGDILSITV